MIELSDINITLPMLKLITDIDEFKGAWNNSGLVESSYMKKLKKISTIESIGSSNRIEGNKLSNIEVETLLKNIHRQSFRSRDEEEIAGYSELLNTIYDSYSTIPLTENYIKQLHSIMLKNTAKDARHCGEYKKISNAVAAFDANGKEIGIVFQTATPFDTPRLMTELVKWTQDTLEERFFHPLIVIGIFIVHFLAIHPFQDGNGRLSRALTNLLLLRCGYAYVPYVSLESIVEVSKDGYYLALRNTQKSFLEEKKDYSAWLNFFLTMLHKQKTILEQKINSVEQKEELSAKAIAVLELFDKHEELTSSIISQEMNFNLETVRKILQQLTERKIIKRYGTTKSRRYRKMNG